MLNAEENAKSISDALASPKPDGSQMQDIMDIIENYDGPTDPTKE